MAGGYISKIDEISISLKRTSFGLREKSIQSPHDAANLVREIIGREELEAREKMIALYFDRQNKVIGYFVVGVGGVSGTAVDTKLVLGVALKTFASGIILSHNHPSGGLKTSKADREITNKIKLAAAYHDIVILDHIIVTKDNYYSFTNEGLMGLSGNYPIIAEYEPPAVELIEDEFMEVVDTSEIEKLKNDLRTYIEQNKEI